MERRAPGSEEERAVGVLPSSSFSRFSFLNTFTFTVKATTPVDYFFAVLRYKVNAQIYVQY